MEKKYLYTMALVALWMAPVTALQAAKAVEERRVGPTDRVHHIGTIATLDDAKAVKGEAVANGRDAHNWQDGSTTADEAKLGGDKFPHDEFPKHPVHGRAYADEGGTLTGKKADEVTNFLNDPTDRDYVDKWEFNG